MECLTDTAMLAAAQQHKAPTTLLHSSSGVLHGVCERIYSNKYKREGGERNENVSTDKYYYFLLSHCHDSR